MRIALKSIEEKLADLDPDVIESELKALVSEIEKTNIKLEKNKILSAETLNLIINY
jgi:hypothetical protein